MPTPPDLLKTRLSRLNQVGMAEPSAYTITSSLPGGALELQFHGHPRMIHTQGLITAIMGVLDALPAPATQVTVELSACTAIDSSTGGFLLLLGKDLGQRGATLRLHRPSERLRRIFATLGLDRIDGIEVAG